MQAATASGTQDSEAADRALLARVAAGDREAFHALYLAYHRRLSRFLLRVAGHYPLVEEVINDTLLAVWRQADTFRGGSRVSTWIFGIAYRQALKTLARQERVRRLESEQAARPGSTAPEDAETAQWLQRALEQLPLAQRLSLELTYFMGYSCQEVAQITGAPVNTVKTRLFHARRQLRQLLPQLAKPGEGG